MSRFLRHERRHCTAQVLEQARKALNVSEKELAERMGVQRPTVTR